MKKQILTLSFALCAAFGYSQTPNSATWPASGNVGFGTATPIVKLDVVGSYNFGSSYTKLAYFGARNATTGVDGNGLYIGHKQMTIPGTLPILTSKNSIFSVNGSTYMAFIDFNTPNTTNTTDSALRFGYGSAELMRINQDGKVRIGNVPTPDGYKFFVDQGILTEKVKVAVSTLGDWSDYVFAPDYKLMPLEEVEQFTKENNHLPNVPSASDMVNEGLDVAKMDAKLLEKVEELTLYIIEQNKTNKAQAEQIEELKAMVKTLMTKN